MGGSESLDPKKMSFLDSPTRSNNYNKILSGSPSSPGSNAMSPGEMSPVVMSPVLGPTRRGSASENMKNLGIETSDAEAVTKPEGTSAVARALAGAAASNAENEDNTGA